MRFRQSFLKTWMDCALKAKYESIDKLPRRQNAKASFGTIIHHCLELYNQTGNLELARETFKDLWQNPEKLGVAPDVWPKFTTWGGLMTRGLEILDGYDEKQQWDDRTIIAQEQRFLVPFGRHELEGTIDHIETRKSGKGRNLLRVVDFKTNGSKPNMAELALNIQFTVYIYATMQPEFWLGNGPEFPGVPNGEWHMQMLDALPRRGIWYHLYTNQELDAGGRDDTDFLRLYRLCDEIEKSVQAGIFTPTISASACGYCDHVEKCGLVIPTKEDLAAEENAWI